MESKHTKGPWEVDPRRDGLGPSAIRAWDFTTIATFPKGVYPKETMDANAELMASAPDLLEQRDELLAALEGLWNDYEREWGSEHVFYSYPLARAAIAKARGETLEAGS